MTNVAFVALAAGLIIGLGQSVRRLIKAYYKFLLLTTPVSTRINRACELT